MAGFDGEHQLRFELGKPPRVDFCREIATYFARVQVFDEVRKRRCGGEKPKTGGFLRCQCGARVDPMVIQHFDRASAHDKIAATRSSSKSSRGGNTKGAYAARAGLRARTPLRFHLG